MTAEVITLKRWTADITYRHDTGNETRTVSFEELVELHNIVETGPNFYAIESIVVRINGPAPRHAGRAGRTAMMPGVLTYGAITVPCTSSWDAEERFSLATCAYFGREAIVQAEAQGEGRPMFGKPHMQRQRKAIAQGLCDICGRALASRTKISQSHARPQPHSANGWEILQVEPMMHRECATIALAQCPSLRRDIDQGTLQIRQVFRWRAQVAIMDEVYVETITGQRVKALGHAKVQLVKWADRDRAWLERSAA